MFKLYSENFPGSKIYFTEADHSSQILYKINEYEFDIKLKLWLLLVDHIIVSTGHILQSDITYDWIKKNKNILDENIILPSLQEDRDSFGDYLNKKIKSSNKINSNFLSKKTLLKKRADFLDHFFNTVISWSAKSESNLFRKSFIRDLEDKNSPLMNRMKGISYKKIVDLIEGLKSCNKLSRSKLYEIVNKCCFERRKTLLKYGDLFYYFSGAHYKDAFPVLHYEATELCKNKISYDIKSLGYKKNDFCREISDLWGISHLSLSKIPLSEIIKIRNDGIGKKVRDTWKNLMIKTRNSKVSDSDLSCYQEAKKSLINIFEKELKEEKKRHLIFEKYGNLGIGLLSFLITELATNMPPISSAAGILSIFFGKPISDLLEKKFAKSELVILSSQIRKKV